MCVKTCKNYYFDEMSEMSEIVSFCYFDEMSEIVSFRHVLIHAKSGKYLGKYRVKRNGFDTTNTDCITTLLTVLPPLMTS